MVIRDRTYTVDEFFDLVNQDGDDKCYELVDGIIVEMPLTRAINSHIAALIGTHLGMYVLENDLGYTFGADGGYALSPNDVRVPDVSFVAKERITGNMHNLIPGAPDLAVEVISPSETARSINEKTQIYFDGGAKVVWLVYPDDRFAEIRTPTDEGFHVITIYADGMLTAKSVLPDFELPLSKVLPPQDISAKEDA